MVTISAAGETTLGPASRDTVSRTLLQFISSAFVGSVTVKARAQGAPEGSEVAIAYLDLESGVNATDAITGNALLQVDATGLELVLDCTAYTSGSLDVYLVPVLG